jgi:hypothetical protein
MDFLLKNEKSKSGNIKNNDLSGFLVAENIGQFSVTSISKNSKFNNNVDSSVYFSPNHHIDDEIGRDLFISNEEV